MIKYVHENEERYPHGADVLEREFSDGGYAKGWAMHCKPVPKYFFDCHIHFNGDKNQSLLESLRPYIEGAGALEVARTLVIMQIYGKKWSLDRLTDNIMDKAPYFTMNELQKVLPGLTDSGKCFWSAYLNYHSSEPELVHAAADAGARGIKLHNAPVIEDNAPYDVWLSKEWQDTFKAIAERRLPVLFHVTQRLPSSAYTGGGRNTYWKKGWENGVTYTNEDLLQAFLTCCRRNPDVSFIGAHQLHLGWERLDELFTGYPNLYVDTTVGCMLRLYDDFYSHDKEFLRDVFVRWSDRIIFGTDTFWGNSGKVDEMNFRKHMRFITALDLPGYTIDRICHGNMERLMGVGEL